MIRILAVFALALVLLFGTVTGAMLLARAHYASVHKEF